jgi:hypothetical protein
MKYSIIESEDKYFNYDDLGDDWGYFIDLDPQPKNLTPTPTPTPVTVPVKNPKKYKYSSNRIHSTQLMDTIKEETIIECSNKNTNDKNNTNDTNKKHKRHEKKEQIIKYQIYSGVAICGLATYICFML